MKAKTTAAEHGFRRPLAVSGTARELIEQARRLEAARSALADRLPTELREGWQLARLDADTLVIVADSAGRATRLRYARSALLSAAQGCIGARPRAFSVKLAPPPRAPRPVERARLTPAAAACLRQAVAGMEDERLRQALLRLARRAEE